MTAPRRGFRVAMGLVAVLSVAGAFYAFTIWSVYLRNEPTAAALQISNRVSVTEVAPDFHVIQGFTGTILVMTGPDGAVVVDTGEPRLDVQLSDVISSITDSRIAYIINTHSHYDHRGSNSALRDRSDEIIMQQVAATELRNTGDAPPSEDDLPTNTFDDEHEIEINGQTIRLVHVPFAHTGGDTVVIFEPANVVASGDVLVEVGPPFISRGGGSSIDAHLRGLIVLTALVDDQTVIVPGHGGVMTRAQLIEKTEITEKTRDWIAFLKSVGVSKRFVPLFHPMHHWPTDQRLGMRREIGWARAAWEDLP